MTVDPAQPQHDPRPRWRRAYDLLADAKPGEVVSYEELSLAIYGRPGAGRHVIQAAVRSAIPTLERELRRTASAVPNEGYRIALPDDHLSLANHHAGKARSSTRRGLAKAKYVDLNAVSEAVRPAMRAMVTFMEHIDSRMADIGHAQRAHAARLQRIEDRLGIKDPVVIDGETLSET